MTVIDSRVVNIDDLKLEHFAKGDKFETRGVRIGPLLGAKDLGYSYDVVPPGKRSCPFHSHRGEEEMFFILRGSGTLRYGTETRRIRAGDVICCPIGGPETAHQIVNDSDAPLAYLSISVQSDLFGPRFLGEPLNLTVRKPNWWFAQLTLTGFKISAHAMANDKEGEAAQLHVFLTI